MTEPTLQAQIDAANAYEALFVPALFGQWAPRIAHAAKFQSGERVVDIACGTGVLAREIASRVAPAGRVVGLDPSPGMLAVARRLAPDVEWREGVAESLPFDDESFDAAASQFGLMFFGDRRQAVREMFRVLVPGGRLAVVVFDGLDSMPAYAAEVALLERTAGRQAADALRAPFALGDREELASLFMEASPDSLEITTHEGAARFPGIRAMVEADLRGWLPVMGVMLSEDQIQAVLSDAERDLAPFATRDGQASFRLSAHFVIANTA